MWIMTTRGFYSAVEKREDRANGTLTIRARRKSDLDRLVEIIPGAKVGKLWAGTDYPWRLTCFREDWENALQIMGSEIDYTNFKDAVKARLGTAVASVYGGLWWRLLELEDVTKPYSTNWGSYGTPSRSTGKRGRGRGRGKGKAKTTPIKDGNGVSRGEITEMHASGGGYGDLADYLGTGEDQLALERWFESHPNGSVEERALSPEELIATKDALDESARQERAQQRNRPAGTQRKPRTRKPTTPKGSAK